ncbi:NAD-dependent epimerase/dehydratase family protein [Variovorax ginsengisoli]|uniref:dTDP-glucose 4,6-dehydratase n=1 Tax=Variovorax ginsengisoli TaxID=363844 RepID=A0ABT9SCV5_9BURK|nr:NAD-dependent epimerase/dehydratase family protein [Variovorax ginsengisoli]MDP9902187.1 dTDP-glucose 4,6-dehydratase [Variovorax ginsengisoli]
MVPAGVQAPFDLDLDGIVDAVGAPCWDALRGQRIFLTGGTGFLGKWMLASLRRADDRLSLGCEITVLSRRPAAFQAEASFLASWSRLRLVQGDVRSFEIPNAAYDIVVHAATDVVAAAEPLDIFDSCVQGTRRVLDFSVHSGAKRVLLVSSGAMYGRQPNDDAGVAEDYEGAPVIGDVRSAYGEGKRVTEWLGAAYASLKGLDVRVARCFAFIGPYLPLDKHFALGNFLRDAMANLPIVIQGDGTAKRTYLYAADMTTWLWAILLRGEHGGTYNVGGDEAVSMAELAQRVVHVLGAEGGVVVRKQATAGMAPDRYVPDTRKARASLMLPAPLPLDEAIARTAAWHGHARVDSSDPAALAAH